MTRSVGGKDDQGWSGHDLRAFGHPWRSSCRAGGARSFGERGLHRPALQETLTFLPGQVAWRCKTFEAPIPGTFFRKPAPDQPPFKGEGDSVAVGDTVGLIEVMKTFTPVVAEAAGRLLAFHVENEDPVMAGQPLYDLDV